VEQQLHDEYCLNAGLFLKSLDARLQLVQPVFQGLQVDVIAQAHFAKFIFLFKRFWLSSVFTCKTMENFKLGV
jgi:hypothetical protein